jgi:hypothetical protein
VIFLSNADFPNDIKEVKGFDFPIKSKKKIEILFTLYFFYIVPSLAFEGKSRVALIT